MLVDVAALAPDLQSFLPATGRAGTSSSSSCGNERLDNVAFTGYVTPDELARLYHASDVLFAQVRQSKLHAVTAVPSKLLEYMAAGRSDRLRGRGRRRGARRGDRLPAPRPRRGDVAAIIDAIRAATTPDGLERACGEGGTSSELPSRADEMRRFVQLVAELAAADR